MDQRGLGELASQETSGVPGVAGGRPQAMVLPDPEATPKASRRRFLAAYKLAVLEELEHSPGQSGAILRREGLYSSHVTKWRKQRRDGTLKALSEKRGKKAKGESEVELEKLRRENARLVRELEKAEVIISTQKKLAEILGVDLPKIAEKSNEKE
jgi:transposase